MLRFVWKRTLIVMALASLLVLPTALVRPTPGAALSSYASATSQACGVCHVNPSGGGARTALGAAFEAIPSHATDPAGAWAQVSGAATTADTSVTTTSVVTPTTGVTSDDDEDEVEEDVDEGEADEVQPTVQPANSPEIKRESERSKERERDRDGERSPSRERERERDRD